MRAAVLGAIVVLVLAGAPAVHAAGSEFALLDAYLAEHDLPAARGDHCERRGGHLAYLAGETPTPPPVGPMEPTNALLAHHFQWHKERSFVTREVSADDADRYGDDFVSYHRAMILDYDAWRSAHGAAPVEPWDPATPIPATFAYDGGSPLPHDEAQRVRQITGSGCIQRATEDPRIARPSWSTIEGGDEPDPMFGHTRLCQFSDLNRLAKAVDFDFIGRTERSGYHASVHGGVGGDLAPVATAPRDPVFWAWHKFLDVSIFGLWDSDCAQAPDDAAAAVADPSRDVPGTAAWVVVAAALVALARRLR